jgi:hypothetical protein
MRSIKFTGLIMALLGIMFVFGGAANAATDVIQYPSNFFVDPANWQSQYRYSYQDWGYTHNPIAGSITSATLNIAAYDVDWAVGPAGEHDLIYAYKGGVQTLLGELTGANDIWNYTSFVLDSTWFADINAGLQVWMDIDSTHPGQQFWAVSLSKSALSIDGSGIPNPNPNPVPEPGTLLLLGCGFLGLACYGKRHARK